MCLKNDLKVDASKKKLLGFFFLVCNLVLEVCAMFGWDVFS